MRAALIPLLTSLTQAYSEGITFHPVISWEAPLDSNTFNNWVFE